MKYRPFIRYETQHIVLRIIPHSSVLNSQSRRFMRSIYELFSVSGRIFKREGFSVALRPAPAFWWVTKLTANSVEFYVAMPQEYADAFRTKFRNHEQWRKSTLEDVTVTFEFPEDCTDTDMYALKYKRHDMFSLNYDYNEQNTPVRDVLGVMHELTEGEAARIYIRAESVSRKTWKKLADYAWETWDKGGMPYRAGLDPVRLLRGIAQGAAQAFYEIKSLLDDFMAAFERSFFHNNGNAAPLKKERPLITNPDRAELLVNGKLSDRTTKKRNLPVFKTSIRYTITSADEVRRGMLARSIANAYAELGGDNRLEPVRINIRAKQALNDLRNWRVMDVSPNLMSTDELGKLTQLPTAALQAEYSGFLTSNHRVETEIPAVFRDTSGILAGVATDRGAEIPIHIPATNADRLFMPRAVNGSPRMGKDQHVINLVVEAKRKHGIGAVIPDFIDERNGHRGMADAVRDHLAPDDIIDINLADTGYAPYLGLQSIFANVTDQRIAADVISEYLTDFLLADGDEDKFQTADFTRTAAKICNGDFTDMKALFTSQTFRQRKIAELGDMFDMDTWIDYDRMTDKDGGMSGKQGQIFGPVLRRLNQIIGSEFLKPMFCQTYNPDMDLYRWMYEGKVVIIRCRMPDGIPMPERIKEILGYWIVMLTFLIKLAQDGKGAGTFLVLNEPHQFMSTGLVHFMKRMLREGPKYRCAPIIVFHDFSAFQPFPGLTDTLLSASVNWHVFKNTHIDTYKKLTPYLCQTFADPQLAFESTKGPDQSRKQPPQFIACWLDESGSYAPAFVCDALPMVGDRYNTVDNSFLTLRHARQYGRPIADVLAEIKQRNRAVR